MKQFLEENLTYFVRFSHFFVSLQSEVQCELVRKARLRLWAGLKEMMMRPLGGRGREVAQAQRLFTM